MSNFVVSARKYRPNRFSDVVGQEHVGQTLKNAQKNDHLAHAFLFCGPRGVGKTTCARILAAVLNCQNITEEFEPCNTCDSCKAFAESASFNIVELDAASNNSVDHIRQLVEQVRFQPQQGKYKIFIIDEVHMLSQAAFNAFLKTLEEPPPYAIFILATTEKHKIIPTILSRCQIFDFRRIQIPAMVEHLQGICAEEGITAEKDALHIIAQKADGALRDALSIFDRIVSFSGKSITYNDVITNLNVLDYDYYFRLTDALLTENVSDVMLIFDDILRKGFESDIFINGLGEHLRNLLVCKDTATLQLLEVSDVLKKRYSEQAQIAPTSFILTALNLVNDCDINYKMARNKRLHVEMAIIKMAYISRAVEIAQNPSAAPQISEEKKTLVPSTTKVASSSNIPTSPKVVVTPNEEVVPPPPQQVYTPPTPSTPLVVKEEEASTPLVTEQPSTTPKVEISEPKSQATAVSTVKTNRFSTPKISLDSLLEEVEEEDKSTATSMENLPDLTLENIQPIWTAYANAHELNSTRTIMNAAELKIVNDEIVALIGSAMAENTLRGERSLITKLRAVMKRPELALRLQVDESKVLANALPKPPKPLTIKDKYLKMQATNPLIRDMIKRFELKPDED